MVFGIVSKKVLNLLNPYKLYLRLRKNRILKRYSKRDLILGDFVSINNSDIGRHVYLGNRVEIYNSKIGDHSYINSKSVINKSVIGKFCSIASNVKLGLGTHPVNFVSTHPSFYSNKHQFKTFADKMYYVNEEIIEVGNDVWIGENVIVMLGVKIGDGAIIAAGAVVTKDVDSYEIVGGVPGKHIKYRFDKYSREMIQASNWWEREESWFEENYHLLLDVKKFIKSIERTGG